MGLFLFESQILIAILLFAFIQSIFGVGLLVFGTPTLLLFGIPFTEALTILLPSSVVISLLQANTGPPVDRSFYPRLALYCLIPLAIALTTALSLNVTTDLNLIVALMLIAFVIIRFSSRIEARMHGLIERNENGFLIALGAVHGLSNLGGGLLTIYAATKHGDKDERRKLISVCYFVFAIVQLTVLAILSADIFKLDILLYAVVSAVVFLSAGQAGFRNLSHAMFDRLFSVLMLAYAVALLFNVLVI